MKKPARLSPSRALESLIQPFRKDTIIRNTVRTNIVRRAPHNMLRFRARAAKPHVVADTMGHPSTGWARRQLAPNQIV